MCADVRADVLVYLCIWLVIGMCCSVVVCFVRGCVCVCVRVCVCVCAVLRVHFWGCLF